MLGGAIAVIALDETFGVTEVIGGLLVIAGLLVTRLSKKTPAAAH